MARLPDDYAIVVGIQHYPEYRSLQGPVADARMFARWLREDPFGGGLPMVNCKLILSSPEKPPVPVKYQIDKAVGQIRAASNAGARRFYFYFSGHGMGTNELDLALCMASWSRNTARAALSSSGYINLFLALGNFQEVVFLLDCCRVREIAVKGQDPDDSVVKPAGSTGAVNSWTAYATEFGTPAFEKKLAEEESQALPPGPRGHFTEALMEALCGGATGPVRGVTAERLESHLKKRTTEIARDHGHDQNARVRPDLRAGANLVFGDYPAESNVVVQFFPPRPAHVVLFGPHGEEIQAGTADSGPWPLNLEAGNYCLKEGATEKFFSVNGGSEVKHVEF